MRRAEYARLRAFMAVAEQGNFARAAGELRLSPSTLSQVIQDLEKELGSRLFHRTTRSVSLTEGGSRLLAKLKPAMAALDEALEEAQGADERPYGTVRLHIPHAALEQYLLPLLGEFHTNYPHIVLDISASDAPVNIVQEGFDVGVRLGEYLEPNMVASPLGGQMRQLAVASPAYIAKHGTPKEPADLQQHQCINWRWHQPGGYGLYEWEFIKEGHRVAVAVNGPLTVSHRYVGLAAALQGVGITMWNERMLAPYIKSGQLIPVLEDWSPQFPGWYVYYLKQPHSPAAVKILVRFLRERAPAMSETLPPGAHSLA
ncbi:LysR family transcriptional regulator [Paramixta manurensis]|uniref:LysR family transcriptional regulator n=1 Tax=Paramixta manurensis TaxID=2740817 RepID=A0A6M8UDC3_9GAMM|nr:LysR family transcriptional regulator [Erwiniaceae bacterium PD-1]